MDIPEVTSEDVPEMFGWILAVHETGDGDQHIIPGGDLREHIPDESCWCNPLLIDHPQAGLCQQHKALDNREAYFEGTRKYN